jgi:PKD repeat protein
VLSPTGQIGTTTIIPKYSTLGNFVWSDQAPTYGAAPVPSFTTTILVTPRTATFDGSASTAANGIAEYYWSFGDGNYAYGRTYTYTFATSGTYLVNLTVIDTLGQRVSITHSVTL